MGPKNSSYRFHLREIRLPLPVIITVTTMMRGGTYWPMNLTLMAFRLTPLNMKAHLPKRRNAQYAFRTYIVGLIILHSITLFPASSANPAVHFVLKLSPR